MKLEVTIKVIDDEGNCKAGYRSELFRTTRNKNLGELTILFSTLHSKARAMFVNGWVLDDAADDGELKCIYCGTRTEGYNYGRHPSSINPNKKACQCQYDTSKIPS